MAGILSFSSICTLTGIAALFAFDERAGAVSTVPDRWLSSSKIRRTEGSDTLLVSVHPQCSCTVATLHEIATLDAYRNPRKAHLSTVVLFDHGQEARRFGARTSGYTELYNAKGELLFKGGVTGSRGHEGDNLGIAQLRTSIDTGVRAAHSSLVFGCALSSASGTEPLHGED